MATRRRPTTDPVAPAGPPDVVPARPRTLSDDLRARTDDELAALLAVRPDLLHPVPADIAGLATRATTTVSTTRALDGLDRWRLQVAEVLAAGPDPMPGADVVATIPDVPEDAVREALASLRERALVWGDDEGWHLVRAAREAFGPWPCGLGPSLSTRPEVAPWADDPDAVAAALADAPPAAAELAARMAAGPPAGQLAHAQRPVSVDSARTPVEWLLARGLLVPLDGETVVLPREVALALRGGRWLVAPEPVRPPVAVGADRAAAQVDAAAGQQAHDAVRLVEDLCDAWAVWPPAELRNGGLGVRDLAATARALDVPERDAATLVEVARAAGLIASDQDESPVWLPTPGYDVWLSRGRGERWAALVRAWWGMLRVPALVGGRDDRGGRINALAPDAERGVAAVVRHEVLAILAEPAAGSVVPPGAVVDVLDARLPRRGGALRELLVDGTLAEAALLGLTGLGALAATGRALMAAAAPPGAETGPARPDPGADPLVAAVEPLLPDPLDHVLLQADLTAVAPGPLDPSLARELALLADVESTGGATVYRFSEGSLRRALDTGRTASDVHALLASRSRTPVPQPLTYLVDDVARRHGAIRVGVASAYVRCDDETTLTALAGRPSVGGAAGCSGSPPPSSRSRRPSTRPSRRCGTWGSPPWRRTTTARSSYAAPTHAARRPGCGHRVRCPCPARRPRCSRPRSARCAPATARRRLLARSRKARRRARCRAPRQPRRSPGCGPRSMPGGRSGSATRTCTVAPSTGSSTR